MALGNPTCYVTPHGSGQRWFHLQRLIASMAACTHSFSSSVLQPMASKSIRSMVNTVHPTQVVLWTSHWSALVCWQYSLDVFIPLPHHTWNLLYNSHGTHTKAPNLSQLWKAMVMAIGNWLKLTGHSPLLPSPVAMPSIHCFPSLQFVKDWEVNFHETGMTSWVR